MKVADCFKPMQRSKGLTMRWSERRTVVRSTFEMTSTLPPRATRALVRRRSSCSRYIVKPRFETTDRIALVISALMLLVGFAALLLPEDFIVAHTSMRGKGVPQYTVLEHVTPSTARWYGLASLLVGAAIAVYVLWATSSDESTPTI
jgi:hypothetical protein